MRSPWSGCRNSVLYFMSLDKIIMLKQISKFLTSLAPFITAVLMVILMYYSYQLLLIYGQSTSVVYFFMMELFGNWLLFYNCKSYIDKSAGNSELSAGLSHNDCSKLRYCPTCQIYKPERSHHCLLCDRCIHQRDHHCFFLGTCVGGHNLCYFIIFCFYACIGCFYSATLLHKYYSANYERSFWSEQYHYYFYPVTLVHWYYGNAELAEVGWVTLLYVAVATVLFTSFSVIQQLTFILKGQTAYEFNKGMLVVHRSPCNNFIHVFGQYWMFRLLIPFPRCRRSVDSSSILKLV